MSAIINNESVTILPCRLIGAPAIDILLSKMTGTSQVWISSSGIGVETPNTGARRKVLRFVTSVIVFIGVCTVVGLILAARHEANPPSKIDVVVISVKFTAASIIAAIFWTFRPSFTPKFPGGPIVWRWDRFDRVDVTGRPGGPVHITAQLIRPAREVTGIDVVVDVTPERAAMLFDRIPVWAGSRFRATDPRPSPILQKIPTLAHRLGAAIHEEKQSDEPTR